MHLTLIAWCQSAEDYKNKGIEINKDEDYTGAITDYSVTRILIIPELSFFSFFFKYGVKLTLFFIAL